MAQFTSGCVRCPQPPFKFGLRRLTAELLGRDIQARHTPIVHVDIIDYHKW